MLKTELLALSQIAKKELSRRQMKYVKGGKTCFCGCCYYPEQGSGDVNANGCAMYHGGGSSNCPEGWNGNCKS